MLDAARPLQKTNNLPLGEGLAELCVFVLLFFSPFSFPDFLTTITSLLCKLKTCYSTERKKSAFLHRMLKTIPLGTVLPR